MLTLTLPFPPSVNELYDNRLAKTRKGKTYNARMLSKDQQIFRADVIEYVVRNKRAWREAGIVLPITGRLEVLLMLHPRNRQAFDVANYEKAVGDALQAAGVILNDSQFDRNTQERGNVIDGGRLVVTISRFVPPEPVDGLFECEAEKGKA